MTDTLETLRSPILLLAVVACGLQAGTYYTWASAVMPGLARVDDGAFVQAMQEVNRAIVNPVFMLTFLGAPALAVLAVATSGAPARPWTIGAAVLAVATVVITGAGNVPLNNALEAAGHQIIDATVLSAARAQFEDNWVRLNIARTLTATGSLACLAVAMLRR